MIHYYIPLTEGCTHGQVACPDGKCIMAEWLCDGRNECEGGWDERNCCKFDGFLKLCDIYTRYIKTRYV